jgi:hypothetical protein
MPGDDNDYNLDKEEIPVWISQYDQLKRNVGEAQSEPTLESWAPPRETSGDPCK